MVQELLLSRLHANEASLCWRWWVEGVDVEGAVSSDSVSRGLCAQGKEKSQDPDQALSLMITKTRGLHRELDTA